MNFTKKFLKHKVLRLIKKNQLTSQNFIIIIILSHAIFHASLWILLNASTPLSSSTLLCKWSMHSNTSNITTSPSRVRETTLPETFLSFLLFFLWHFLFLFWTILFSKLTVCNDSTECELMLIHSCEDKQNERIENMREASPSSQTTVEIFASLCLWIKF